MPQQYQPPPYPPPDRQQASQVPQYAPPPGPPPGYEGPQHPQSTFSPSNQVSSSTHPQEQQAPIHDWQAVPDTSFFPPPPALPNDFSPTANATADQGQAAYDWCKANPLTQPLPLTPAQHAASRAGDVSLIAPHGFAGSLTESPAPRRGHWTLTSHAGCPDSCIQTALPLYSALSDSPLLTEVPKTVYFELRVVGVGAASKRGLFHRKHAAPQTLAEAEAGVAIGFVARPYPEWRLPGWQRGSLGVHGDDGRRFVNDDFGGVEFTEAFQKGETVGLGMVFRPGRGPVGPDGLPGYGGGVDVEVFFTRDGRKVGGWDLREETDGRKEGGVAGMEGEMDLFGAVGVFGALEVEVVLREGEWLWKG